MVPDFSALQPFLSGMPPTIAVIFNGLILLVSLFAFISNAKKGKEKVEEEDEEDDEDDHRHNNRRLNERAVIALETLAANAPLHTEALKTIAAVQTIQGQAMEEGFDTLRIFKAVHEALEEEARKREEREAREDARRPAPRRRAERDPLL